MFDLVFDDPRLRMAEIEAMESAALEKLPVLPCCEKPRDEEYAVQEGLREGEKMCTCPDTDMPF